MGPPTAQPDQRSLHVHARSPCSATLEPPRPHAFSQDSPTSVTSKINRPKFRPATEDFSQFTNRSSTIIRSSHPAVNGPRSPGADSWSPVLYDPSSDSVRIIPPSRRTPLPLLSQLREFKDKINGVKNGVQAHRLAGLLSSETSDSQPLPSRAHTADQKGMSSGVEVHNFVQSLSASAGRTDWREFDLMAPPPGRRRSTRMTQDDSATRPQSLESADADPSKALASQIASSVMQERSHVRGTEAALLPVLQKDHTRRNIMSHRTAKSHSSTTGGTKSMSRRSAHKTRSVPPSRRPSEDEDDPFPYDKLARQDMPRRASPLYDFRIEKEGGVETSIIEYPCPFRRRNPVLFNVRDHEQCAQRPFSDMTELKRHIRTYHQRSRAAHHCPRCKRAFGDENALSDHLTVPVEEMCEPRPTTSEYLVEDGIAEATDRILADSTATIKSWEELWWLLFPQDTAVLEAEFSPVIEAIETEQEFDDSAAELKSDLCDALARILPDQAGDGPLFQVLAGQLQLVLEQHRAKVMRRCRQNATTTNGDDKRASVESRGAAGKPHAKTSRFSVATTTTRRPSLHAPDRSRRSHIQSTMPPPRRLSISPASSVYSQGSSSGFGSRHAASRATSLSSVGGGSSALLHVESPRLPFRDWVHSVKLSNNSNNSNNNNKNNAAAEVHAVSSSPSPPGQRDSGLALQCEECGCEECQCGSYADQLSAFLTPGVVVSGSVVEEGKEEEEEEEAESVDEDEWAGLYGRRSLLAAAGGGPVRSLGLDCETFGKGRSSQDSGRERLRARSPGVQRAQGEFI